MARRQRGRPVDGWLVIDKPLGPTSTQVLGRARRALGARKAGHAGTLDPLATGVLAIAFGEATKTVAAAQEGRKTYRFTVRLGQATDTDDAEGSVIAESDARPEDAGIEAALAAFRGEILQVPPAFSAVKVAGARAYDLARAGAVPELAARPLSVARLALVARPDRDHAVLELDCGKGGYVRSIGRDLGRALGCHAHVTELRRLAAGPFTLAQALPFEALDAVEAGMRAAPLLPVAAGLAGLPEIPVAPADAARIARGEAVAVAAQALGLAEGAACWASAEGRAVATGTLREGRFRPGRVIHPPEDAAGAD